jgi:hypothetical protein
MCDPHGVAKKAKKTRKSRDKSTEWALGQPLAFPKKRPVARKSSSDKDQQQKNS